MDVKSLAVSMVSAYAPTNYSFDAVKDSFYDPLGALLRRTRRSDRVVVASDMNAQVGKLNTDEAQLSGCLGLDSRRTNNGASHKLFLCSTNFRNKGARLYTWRPPSTDQR